MDKLKPCPFCGGEARLSFKDYAFYGQNYIGDKKKKYRVQVICNRCYSRGKPIVTGWLINPDPYASIFVLGRKTNTFEQEEMFEPYVRRAIEAWNRRADDEQIH